jgi:hypothetical protein
MGINAMPAVVATVSNTHRLWSQRVSGAENNITNCVIVLSSPQPPSSSSCDNWQHLTKSTSAGSDSQAFTLPGRNELKVVVCNNDQTIREVDVLAG